jgi:hypothetical protein
VPRCNRKEMKMAFEKKKEMKMAFERVDTRS